MPRTICSTLIALMFFAGSFLLVLRNAPREEFAGDRDGPENERLEMAHALEAMRWYNHFRALPADTIPAGWREKAMQNIRNNALQKTAGTTAISWTGAGPDNIGGRTRALAIDPTNHDIMYAGCVSGGLWKTTDGGSSWAPLMDNLGTMIINCVAIDPANSSTLYAGTGEGYFNVDALRGQGVLKSTDGGSSWTSQRNFSGTTTNYKDYYVYKIIVQSNNNQWVWAALLGGLFRSTNGGNSWNKISVGSRSGYCVDLVEDPNNPNTFYASFGLSDQDGIYKTTNSGSTWSWASNGFPASGYTRTSIAIGTNNSQVLYASLNDSATSYTKAMMKTVNGGTSWSSITIPYDNTALVHGTHLGGQGWYNNVVAVDPTNSNIVYAGGINMFKSTDGGNNWNQLSDGNNMHVDQHVITFDPANSSVVLFGNDGGVWKSANGGGSFTSLNHGYITTQFYSAATHPYLDIRIGGTQDNGTLKSNTTTQWLQIFSGDGGFTTIDSTSPSIYYTEYVYLGIRKSTNSGTSFALANTGIPPSDDESGGTSDRCAFIAPFEMDPNNHNRLLGGTYVLYETTDGAGTWHAFSGDLCLDGSGAGQVGSFGSVISAIAIAKNSPQTIYAGTTGSATKQSYVRWTFDNGLSWGKSGSTLPNRAVTSLAVDPNNNLHVFAAFSGYGSSTPGLTGHVYANTNPGVIAWTDISNNLPDIPVNKLLLDPSNVSHILAATDLGVFETTNGGTNWVQTGGLPNVPVSDLDIRSYDHVVLAGTHGRGMYVSTGSLGIRQSGAAQPLAFALQQNYPNPFNPVTNITFTVARRSAVRLMVYDAAGREVATLADREMNAGTYQATFNGSSFASGIYFCRMLAQPFDGSSPAVTSEVRKMALVK